MGRRPQPANPASDAAAAFAAELRALRDQARMSVPSLASRTGVPRSTIYGAFKGDYLPNWGTVRPLVLACKGDEETWLLRWEEANAETRPAPQRQAVDADRSSSAEASPLDEPAPNATREDAGAPTTTEPRRRLSRRTRRWGACLAVAAGLASAALVLGYPASSTGTASLAVTGTVICSHGAVTGVWIVPSRGLAGWADLRVAGSVGHWERDVPRGANYQVHVGCGGSRIDYDSNNYSGSLNVSNVTLRCSAPPRQSTGFTAHGTCQRAS